MPSTSVALSVIILAEARELLSALRRNRRFGYLLPFATPTQPNEHPLVKELKSLRDVIRVPITAAPGHQFKEPASSLLVPVDALLNALEPFFEVIRSREASGIITGVALQSLCRIATRLIDLTSATNTLSHYATILSAIVDAASACRFDATDPASDEVVLARIARVVSIICASDAVLLLSDASILRAVEACLSIASGRRRASDLLKRTADAALVDIFDKLGRNIPSFSSSHAAIDMRAQVPSVFASGVGGSAFGYALDSDAFSQHGPASLYVVVAVIELASRMADPFYAQSLSERILGLQLLSTIIGSAGSSLRAHTYLKKVILRDCARGILRSLGMFKSQPSIIAYGFTISTQLIRSLEEEAAPFLLALLERVFPYYISGHENMLPRICSSLGANGTREISRSSNTDASSLPSVSLNHSTDVGPVTLDPVIREIGLEALADLLSVPGLLCVAYRLADCDISREDVVEPLLKSLGQAAKLNGLRRRSKRLRASTSGTNRSSATNDVDSDEEDPALNMKGNPELSRFSRSAAILCSDSILAVIDTISDRLKLETAGIVNPLVMDEVALKESRRIRKEKVRLQKAALAFNISEKVGKASKLLLLLREHGLVDNKTHVEGTVQDDLDSDVRSIVRFIRETPGLSKEKIGNILGEPDNLSRRVLADYSTTFNFEGRHFTESLRVYLESFRLPGEAQKIDRIVQSFASRYFSQNDPSNGQLPLNRSRDINSLPCTKDAEGKLQASSAHGISIEADSSRSSTESRSFSVLKSADAAYVLSFSVVMLNTDQHNDSIRKKMALEDFVKNCRGINDGEDLPKWFLSEVFDSIAAVEIRMSDEAGVGALTDILWNEHLRHSGVFHCPNPTFNDSRVFDEEVFHLVWESGVVAANSILKEAGEPNSVQKALEGFLSISRCAATYKSSHPIDAIISSLCNATTVREGPLQGAVVRFGTDIKAQMASVALSGVSRECGDWLRFGGWQALVVYFLRLHALCLLPTDLEQRIGGYGSELVKADGQPISSSQLIPVWWPSRVDRPDVMAEATKPRKSARPNGFFAAILAASIGSEAVTDDDEEDYRSNGFETSDRAQRRTSRTPPYYIRTRTREDTEARDLARKCIAGCRIEDVIINEAKVLQSKSLEHLCKAIAQSALKLVDIEEDKVVNENVDDNASTQLDEESVLDWTAVMPSSPKNDSSIIVGITPNYVIDSASETTTEFGPFGSSQTWEGSLRERDERKAREFVVAFCIDVLCELTLQNRDRLHITWPELHRLLVRIITPSTHSSAILERAVVALLRTSVRLLHREELKDDLLRGLNLLIRLPPETAEALSAPVAAGIFNIVKDHGSVIQNTSGWHALLSIIESLARYNAQARELGLETVRWILKHLTLSVAVSEQTFAPLLDSILAYISCSSVDTSIEALELLYLLSQEVATFSANGNATEKSSDVQSEQKDDELWSEYWGPLFHCFASAVRDPRGKVRNCALSVLERVFASRGSTELLSANQWYKVLLTVVLPLMTQLFSTQGYFTATLEAEKEAQRKIKEERTIRNRSRSFATSIDHDEQLIRSVTAACSRTRMRAVVLTSKTFLQHHIAIAAGLSEGSFTKLWMDVIEVFRIAVESGSQDDDGGEKRGTDADDVNEHVPESVKNMLLVLCDSGLLSRKQQERWDSTFTMVRRFIPDIEEAISAATGAKSPKAEGQTQRVVEEPNETTNEPSTDEPKGYNGKAENTVESSAINDSPPPSSVTP